MFALFLLLIFFAVVVLIIRNILKSDSAEHLIELLKIEHHWKVHGNSEQLQVVQNEYG